MGKTEELFKQVNLDWHKLRDDPLDSGYDYLINDYIPNQGKADMLAFIDLGFSPLAYLLWKLDINNLLEPPFSEALKKRLTEVFGKYPSPTNGEGE